MYTSFNHIQKRKHICDPERPTKQTNTGAQGNDRLYIDVPAVHVANRTQHYKGEGWYLLINACGPFVLLPVHASLWNCFLGRCPPVTLAVLWTYDPNTFLFDVPHRELITLLSR